MLAWLAASGCHFSRNVYTSSPVLTWLAASGCYFFEKLPKIKVLCSLGWLPPAAIFLEMSKFQVLCSLGWLPLAAIFPENAYISSPVLAWLAASGCYFSRKCLNFKSCARLVGCLRLLFFEKMPKFQVLCSLGWLPPAAIF